MKIIRVYSCLSCDGPVTKPPCVAPPPAEKNHKGQTNKVSFTYHGLGGWRCDSCGVAKVKVTLKGYNANE